jgi:hypothetical protein
VSGAATKSRKYRKVPIPESHPPFRAETQTKTGSWRWDVIDALQDAKSFGPGARVIDSLGTLLGRFTNAVKSMKDDDD